DRREAWICHAIQLVIYRLWGWGAGMVGNGRAETEVGGLRGERSGGADANGGFGVNAMDHQPSPSDLVLFRQAFSVLSGNGNTPFPWQERLFGEFVAGRIPSALDLPTGL